MLATVRGLRGIVTSPHHAASRAGLDILRDGGSAVEAVVATAATLAVVYPQMNSIGGDGFWLIAEPGEALPVGIDAAGSAGEAATLDFYTRHGLSEIPRRGPMAANTVAGTVAGWAKALDIDGRGRDALPLARILRDPIGYAEQGVSIAASTASNIAAKQAELEKQHGFARVFLPNGLPPEPGAIIRQPALARSLALLAKDGLDSFYRGALGDRIGEELERLGTPVSRADLASFHASVVRPLRARYGATEIFNLPPPTQGIASLLILSLYSRIIAEKADGFDHLHRLIEATKRAFRIRDWHVGDPSDLSVDLQALLDDDSLLDSLAGEINMTTAQPWPLAESGGDTVWMGAIDSRGQAVSMIQSTYFEFGSGIVLENTGITWQNRGSSFRLAAEGVNRLRPGARPFHTLNPALARFPDGRVMCYGTMGGEGQPQTQATLFTRYASHSQELQQAITAPRFLLGRTWGDPSTTLKLEENFGRGLIDDLAAAGHDLEVVPALDEMMGHAGAVVRHADGRLEGATDPRSDGAVAAF